MKKTRYYNDYQKYLDFQSEKTLNPEKREKWLGVEWNQKIDGFEKEFLKIKSIISKESKILCVGARTGQEVVALKNLGYSNAIGIDIVEHEPHVKKGDMHDLEFEDDSFDIVYSNILDHSIYPEKFVSEVERVLKVGGFFFLQIQLGIDQDKYTEYIVENPFYDVIGLFNKSYCIHITSIERNFAGMNFEFVFQKDEKLTGLFKKYGTINSINVPENYSKIWKDINLEIQNKKLDNAKIFSQKQREEILSNLEKRAYYLTRIAEIYNTKNIAEIGTAEGWQCFSFAEYCKEVKGHVYSCDPRDVVNKSYLNKYKDNSTWIQGTSKELSQLKINFDLIYVDGLHDKGEVIKDVANLSSNQNKNVIWIFDDFDERFGCFNDIVNIAASSKKFKVWKVGLTASGQPSHQVMTKANFRIEN